MNLLKFIQIKKQISSATASQLQGTKFLKTTGILDAYEHVVSTMVANGWPSDKSVFDHAAYEVLKWAADHKDQYKGLVGRNIEAKQDAIFASRDNIPELSQYKLMQEVEKHKVEVANDLKVFGRTEKIQLKSRKMYTLTRNKLDVSIFQFKDRPIFKKREPSPNYPAIEDVRKSQGGGFDDIRQTRPTKKPLAKVQETDFTFDEQVYQRDNDMRGSQVTNAPPQAAQTMKSDKSRTNASAISRSQPPVQEQQAIRSQAPSGLGSNASNTQLRKAPSQMSMDPIDRPGYEAQDRTAQQVTEMAGSVHHNLTEDGAAELLNEDTIVHDTNQN